VCELGAGMAGLAGVAVAAGSEAEKVVLSEGNPQCVSNLETIIAQNQDPACSFFKAKEVSARQILWDTSSSFPREFDVILVADCFYALDVHESLLHVIKSVLKPGGEAYLMAPLRSPRFLPFSSFSELSDSSSEKPCRSKTVLRPLRRRSRRMAPLQLRSGRDIVRWFGRGMKSSGPMIPITALTFTTRC